MQGVLVLLALGVGLGIIIGGAAKLFAVESDPRVEKVEGLLAGINCGACGHAGCAAFAQALVRGEDSLESCPVTEAEGKEQIAELLGVSFGVGDPKVALVHCGGDKTKSAFLAGYNGVNDCASANLVAGGAKACKYGCLGLGTCARVCPFGAIEITENWLAVVHQDLCTACGKCIEACPRGLIELVSRTAPLHNYCNNPEKGAASKKVCSVSCIACRKCVKNAEEGQMYMDGNLAKVNYENPPVAEVAEVCPTGCLQAVSADTGNGEFYEETSQVKGEEVNG